MQSEWRALNAGAIQDWGLEAISKSIRPALTTCPCVKTGFSTGTPSTVRPIAKRFLRCAWVEDRQHPLSSIFSVSLCTCRQTYRHLLKDGRAHHILIGSRIDRKEPRRREDIPRLFWPRSSLSPSPADVALCLCHAAFRVRFCVSAE